MTMLNTPDSALPAEEQAPKVDVAERGVAQAPVPTEGPSVPSWYKSILDHLLFFAAQGVSDVHLISDAHAWIVEKDKTIQTTLHLTKGHILALADYWQPGDRHLQISNGAKILAEGDSGALETMQQIGAWRARIVFRRQENGYGVTMRFIPPDPPSLESNPLPKQVTDLLDINNGLFIVSGPTGSGKTTLLATLIREYNIRQHKHIYTIEDPIEFVHKPINSLVTQREVGRDADSFAAAIQTAVRSKAQVILVGELRELSAVRAALDAANKGHLVFATAHASSAAQCVQQMVSDFPADEQNMIRNRLAEVMKIIMVQRLVPNTDGNVIPVHEIMVDHTTTTPRIRDGNFDELTQALKPESNMISFEQSLFNLYAEGKITEETALAFANVKGDLDYKINRVKARQLAEATEQ